MTLLDPALPRRLLAVLVGALAAPALVAVVVAAVVAALPAPPAAAHPFGDPQTVEVTAEGDGVRVRWRAGAADDLTALAAHLGLLPPERVLLDGAVLPEDGDDEVLAAAPVLGDYLLDHVRVSVGDRDCVGDALPVDDLTADGAVLDFDCGGLGDGRATVAVDTLTDLHPLYRTLATGPGDQRAVYDADHPVHGWALTGSAAAGATDGTGRSAAVQLGSVGGVLAVGGVAAAVWVRRRARRPGAVTR